MKITSQLLLVACVLLLPVFPRGVRAENWPGWRGPRGDGTSLENQLPIQWNAASGQNLVWKIALPGSGHASPIVWEDRVFVVSCDEQTQNRLLICSSCLDGTVLWQRTVLQGPLETKHNLNSYASSTPATDGERVYVSFLEVDGRTVPARNVGQPRPVTVGRIVVAAYDFAGRQVWLRRLGEFVSAHGFCSSPVVYGNSVIINGDHDGDARLYSLDRSSGEIQWQQTRPHQTRSYVTPIIRDVGGRTQLVFSGSKCVTSYDPRDGTLHWSLEGPTEQFVASLVCDGSRFFLAAGYPTYHVMAIEPDGQGDVTDTHVAWHRTNARCYVPSPVVADGYLVVADDRGTANCFETENGRRLWQARIGSHFSTSLITAGGLVYLQADDGIMTVIRPGSELQVVAKSELGESTYASPAVSNGRIYIRGEDHLFCFGEPPQPSR